MPLSSQVVTQISWSPLSGLKGVRPPLQFGQRTWDCALGKAGKEGPHLARTGASQGVSSSCGARGGFLTRQDEDLREPLVRCQGSQVSVRVARGSASWLSSHGRGLGPRDVLKKDSRIPPQKTRRDSLLHTLQVPCDPSQIWRGPLRFLPPFEMRPSSIAPNPVE